MIRQSPWLITALTAVSLLLGAFDAVRPFVWAGLLQGSLTEPIWQIGGIFWFLGFEILGYLFFASRDLLAAHFATGHAAGLRVGLARRVTDAHSSRQIDFATSRYVESVRYDVDVVEDFLRSTLWAALTGAVFLAVNGFLNVALPTSLALAYATALFAGCAFNLLAFRILVQATKARLTRESEFSVGSQMHYRKSLQLMRGPQKNVWLGNRLRQTHTLATARRRQYGAQLLYQYGAPLLMLAVFGVVLFAQHGDVGAIGASEMAAALSVAFLVGPLSQLFAFAAELAATKEAWRRIHAPERMVYRTEPHPAQTYLWDAARAAEALRLGKSVLVDGPSGSGKTTLAVSVLDALNEGGAEGRKPRRAFYLSEATFFELPSLDPHRLDAAFPGKDLQRARRWEADRLQGLVERFFPNHSQNDLDRIMRTALGPDGEPFSSGERQRIQLICCLMERPEILLLDEALSGCDPEAEQSILQFLLTLPIALLLINHRPECRELFRGGRPDRVDILTRLHGPSEV